MSDSTEQSSASDSSAGKSPNLIGPLISTVISYFALYFLGVHFFGWEESTAQLVAGGVALLNILASFFLWAFVDPSKLQSSEKDSNQASQS